MADVAPIKFYGRSKRNAVVPIDTRRPDWLRVRLPGGQNYSELKGIMRGLDLHTVCEEARCPNIGECWNARTASFMILGDTCTRACGFCAVKTGRPGVLDLGEPVRVAEAVERMGLKHAVITSVNRDELEDGGAAIFAGTIRHIRRRIPTCGIEVLIPDFMGDEAALATVMRDRKSTRLNSSHGSISYAVFCLKKKKRLYEQRKTDADTKRVPRGRCRHQEIDKTAESH